MDADIPLVPTDAHGRMRGEELRKTVQQQGRDGIFAVVATAGSTNLGVIDDLEGIADVCAELGVWMHVDGAYGAAALGAPSARHSSGVSSAPTVRSVPMGALAVAVALDASHALELNGGI
jgi:glutamate/tyrosine decarboxylase-like PLP-dependent enzyme